MFKNKQSSGRVQRQRTNSICAPRYLRSLPPWRTRFARTDAIEPHPICGNLIEDEAALQAGAAPGCTPLTVVQLAALASAAVNSHPGANEALKKSKKSPRAPAREPLRRILFNETKGRRRSPEAIARRLPRFQYISRALSSCSQFLCCGVGFEYVLIATRVFFRSTNARLGMSRVWFRVYSRVSLF